MSMEIVPYESGYKNKTSSPQVGDGDLYISKNYIGILHFGNQIGSHLGIGTITNWSDINFISASLTLKNKDTMRSDSTFSFALCPTLITSTSSNDLPSTATMSTIPQTISNTTSGVEVTFNLLSLFQSLNDSSGVQPDTNDFYLYVIENTTSTTSKRFTRYSQHNQYLRATAEIGGTVHYYDGSKWVKCNPYYYNGTDWIKCQANYFDGTNWIKCK